MRKTRSPLRGLSACVLAALLCAACGGGGGGGGGPPLDAFAGTWHYAGYITDFSSPNPAAITADFGTVVADGVGGFDLTHGTNTNTVVGGSSTDTGLAYELPADGTLSWTLAPPAGQPVLGGALSGGLGLLSSVTPPPIPSLRVLVRRAGTFSAATLAGDYHTVSLAYLDPSDIGYVGTTTFDGIGASTGSGTTNREGLHQAATPAYSYTVTPQGDLTLTGATIGLEGGVLAGGDVAVAAGGTTTGQTTTLELFVRESTSASLLTFAGEYLLVAVITSGTEDGTLFGMLVADGAGGWTGDFQLKVAGAVGDASPGTESGTYSVASDGALSIAFTGAPTPFEGGVSPDGSFAVAGGPLTGSTLPMLWVLLRR